MNISVFSLQAVSATISRDVTVRARGFFMRGKGMWLLHFLYFHIYIILEMRLS